MKWPEFQKLIESRNFGGKISKDNLPTPALVVDLDIFEANLNKMASHLNAAGKGFRPHAKTHKCVEIAEACIRVGAVGTCTAKISEAEVFAASGLSGLLVTTPLVGSWRIERAVALALDKPDTIYCADHPANVDMLSEAAKAAGIELNVAIDLLVGGRTGMEPGKEALQLAQKIDTAANLRFAGIQAFAGPCAHTHGFEARKGASEAAMSLAVDTRILIERSGIGCRWLSGSSTGAYNIDSAIDGVTELQPGSFLFMDIDYAGIGGINNSVEFDDFGFSLSVITTVFSKPSKSVAIVDAGFKAFSTDRPFPPRLKTGDSKYNWAGDEHGRLDLNATDRSVELGDRLEFLAPHCDPTVNLYDSIYGVRGQQLEAVWKIAARGMTT